MHKVYCGNKHTLLDEFTGRLRLELSRYPRHNLRGSTVSPLHVTLPIVSDQRHVRKGQESSSKLGKPYTTGVSVPPSRSSRKRSRRGGSRLGDPCVDAVQGSSSTYSITHVISTKENEVQILYTMPLSISLPHESYGWYGNQARQEPHRHNRRGNLQEPIGLEPRSLSLGIPPLLEGIPDLQLHPPVRNILYANTPQILHYHIRPSSLELFQRVSRSQGNNCKPCSFASLDS